MLTREGRYYQLNLLLIVTTMKTTDWSTVGGRESGAIYVIIAIDTAIGACK